MAPYTLESSQTTTDHLNKHFPTIYIVSQRHILRDLYRWHNNFWCEQIFSDTIARGVVVDRKVGANFIRWRESGRVSFKTFKTEKQKKKVFRLQTPLITSWFRENIWMLQIKLFLILCTQMWEGRTTFWKGVCVPLFLPLAPAWVDI